MGKSDPRDSAPDGLPTRERILEHLRSQGRRPHSLPYLEERFDVPRERSRQFQGILKTLEEDGMVRKVKGRKFVAEDENGPAARKREKNAKRGNAAPVPAEPIEVLDIPIDEGAEILFDSDTLQAPGKSGSGKGGTDRDRPVPGRGDGRSSAGGQGNRPGKGGSKFIPRGGKEKGGFRDRDGGSSRHKNRHGRRDERPYKGEGGGAGSGDRQASRDEKDLVKGKLIRQGGFHFVIPAQAGRGRASDGDMVLIPRRNLGQARPGDIVSARIVEDDHGEKMGKIVATLKEDIPFAEVSKHFFKEYALPYGYPKRALQEAGSFPEPVFENYEDRRDFRSTHIITIDPSTAKDHDDAISLQRKKDGSWLLGVHIADVAEYVASDTSLDDEAVQRAFTQYLPWTAAPMLPQRLSSDLCSLLEGRERLAFSCMMEVSPDGELKSFEFVESFIRVERFYSYEQAQASKEEGDAFLILLDEFTSILLAKRRKDGFIDFSFPEPKVEVENGVPVRIYPGKRLASHSWIEECMLLANQATAKYLTKHKLPGLFRVHEQPDLDVVSELWASQGLAHKDKGMAEAFKDMDRTRSNLNPAIQKFFIRLLGKEGGVLPAAVQRKILQSMKKAQYSTEPSGHFALGWLYYAHFTSPIRRYADLWTHRVIKAHVRGRKVPKNMKVLAKDVGERISEREIAVMKVERKGLKTATAWVLRDHIGEEFVGEVSGLENFGIFVSISEPMGEGLIPIRSLRDDYYEKDETTGHLVGKRTRQRFELGDKLRVRLDRSDPFTSQVDFDFLGRP
ncbi:MAG TPA: RNB domain-containing ribonuclease [Fibrobacteria bacterium]|nr:RNB domain-containing ribonuclease [Fibrobacteria bacterium]